jgi:integrase
MFSQNWYHAERFFERTPDGLVFPANNGKALRNNNVLRRRLHPILEALSIREGGMHGFRHGRVSFLVENDTPVEVIKAWIGHGSERMLRLYTHLHPQVACVGINSLFCRQQN